MTREMMGLLVLVLSLMGCGKMEQVTPIEHEEPDMVLDSVLLSEESEEIAGLLQIRSTFLVPETCSKTDVETHTNHYIATLKKQHENLYVLIITYYDDLLFLEFGDCPLASVLWGPNARSLYPQDEYTVGDFSTHKISIDYQALNEEYIMTDSQKKFISPVARIRHAKTRKNCVSIQ